MMSFKNQKILILGLGLSGKSAARYLLKRGAHVWGVDQSKEIDTQAEICDLKSLGLNVLHEKELPSAKNFDRVVVSPGIPSTHPLYRSALDLGTEILGEVELACRHLTNRCVAITGSNGKTTTTLLVEHALSFSGIPAKAVGNIGIPLTEAVDKVASDDVIVLELSSWQLETLHSKVIDAGVILNITPNHLDRHLTMENYAAAKFNLKNCLKKGRTLYMGHRCLLEFPHLINESKIETYGYSPSCTYYCDQSAVKKNQSMGFVLPEEYRGKISHDVDNMMAAYALCREMGLSGEQFAASLPSFKKPPHRIEFVKKIKGVAYYDDSKGTNLDAVAKAVASMQGPTILIAGGMHKGAAYTPWLEAFGEKVRCICAIGQAAEQIKSELGAKVCVETFMTLEGALTHAASIAKEGENVLLSPGCSSYDMFTNYEHRGDEFKRIVHALPVKEGKQS